MFSNPLISLPNLAAYHSLAEIFSLALLNAHGTYLVLKIVCFLWVKSKILSHIPQKYTGNSRR